MTIDPQRMVTELAITELYTLTPDTAATSALRMAMDQKVDYMLVLDQGTLVGLVGKGDIACPHPHDTVNRYMATPVLCIAPTTTVREALQIMDEQKVSCLPIVTGTFLVGMVTRDHLEGKTPKPADHIEVRAPN